MKNFFNKMGIWILAAAVVIVRKIRRRSGMKKPLFKKKNDVKPDDKSGDT